MGISSRVETIFAIAAGLAENERMKNTIYCKEDRVYILNSDNTILLRFPLRSKELPFTKPVAFKAADYEGSSFSQDEDGRVVFDSVGEGYTRKVSCNSPDQTPEQIEAIFKRYSSLKGDTHEVSFSSSFLSLLDRELSHVEFQVEEGKLWIRQRNIYSGALIEITPNQEGLLGSVMLEDFGPIALRTGDFAALFTFHDTLTFRFTDKQGYCTVVGKSATFKMQGIIAQCLYDELGVIRRSDFDGRKKQKRRTAKQAVDKSSDESSRDEVKRDSGRRSGKVVRVIKKAKKGKGSV